jgi:hypothetical protein
VARGLRVIGANNVGAGRGGGLGGRGAWAQLDARYAELGDGGAGLPATWELIRLVLRKPDV